MMLGPNGKQIGGQLTRGICATFLDYVGQGRVIDDAESSTLKKERKK